MLTSRTWRKHKTNIVFGGIILGSLALSSPDIARNMQSISSVKSQIANQSEKQVKLEQQFQFEQEQAKIADARYEKGCLPSVIGHYPDVYYASVYEGQVLSDRHTGRSMPPGTVVCDGQGNTGVISEGGTVEKIAFTGNRDLVAKRLGRFRGGVYAQPVERRRYR